MSSLRTLSFIVSLAFLVVFGYVFGLGIVPYVTTPPRTVDAVHSLNEATRPSLLWGGLGSLVGFVILALLIATRKKPVVRNRRK